MLTETTKQTELSPDGYTEQEEAVHRLLIEAGLVKKFKPRSGISKLDRPLLHIEGKPLSETIIEERR